MIRVSTNEQGNIYSVRLSGTIFNVILVGIVNYLKERKKIRAVAAVAGFIGSSTFSVEFQINYNDT